MAPTQSNCRQVFHDAGLNLTDLLDQLRGDLGTFGQRDAKGLQAHEHPRRGEDGPDVDDDLRLGGQQLAETFDRGVIETVRIRPVVAVQRCFVLDDPLRPLPPTSAC